MIFVLCSPSPGAAFTGSVTHMEKTSAKSNYKTSATDLTKISIQFTERIYFCGRPLQRQGLSFQNKMLSHGHLRESEFVCTHPKATPVKIPQEDSTFLAFFWTGKVKEGTAEEEEEGGLTSQEESLLYQPCCISARLLLSATL